MTASLAPVRAGVRVGASRLDRCATNRLANTECCLRNFSVVPSLDHGNGNNGQDSATTLFQPVNPLR
jgi:hypothetical protein